MTPSAHADRPILIGFLADQFDKWPKTVEISWGKLCEHFLLNPEESPCALPGLLGGSASSDACAGSDCAWKSRSSVPRKPMAFVPGVVEGARLDRNTRALTLLVLDFDHLAAGDAVRVEGALAASGVECAVYTTHNHRPPTDVAFRAVLLLSRAVAADQWHRFLPAAIARLGVSVERVRDGDVERQPDPRCKNRSRIYYLPSHPRGAPSDAALLPGEPLNVDRVLAEAPPAPPRDDLDDDFSDREPLPDETAWSAEDARRVAERAAARFPARRRNEFCLALAGVLRRAGADRDTARAIVLAAARAGGSDAPEDRAKTVDHTYDLDEDAPLSGFTRICEIVGEAAARAIGDVVVDAKNSAFFRGFGEVAACGEGDAPAPPAAELTSLPAASWDLGEIRDRLRAVAASRARSPDRPALVSAVLLRRALAGEALAREAGGDPETDLSAEDAARRVVEAAAHALPPGTPFEAVAEVLRISLAATPGAPAGGWLAALGEVYRRAARTREVRGRQEALAAARQRRAVLSNGPPPLPGDVDHSPPPLSGASETDPEPDGAWKDLLRKRGDGSLAPIPHNARVILEHDPVFRGVLGWNDVTKVVEVRATGGPLAKYAGPAEIDAVASGVQDLLASAWDLAVPYRDVERRVVAIARSRPFDPLADYLRSICWDGTSRVSGWLATYCGADDSPYSREVGRRWLTALVARGLRPGTKVDNVLVLEGVQGLGKSSAFEIIGGNFFCDTGIMIGDKDSQLLAGRYWICELAEMVSIRRTGQHSLKHFFSRRVDSFRRPYGRGYEDCPRRCLFVATTNDASYLTDETGNRKYWCVTVSYVEEALARLRADRDQILAEAVAIYRAAETCPDCRAAARCRAHRWWFAYDEIALTEEEAEQRVVETPARLRVESWWYGMEPGERPEGFTTMDVAEAALDLPTGQVKDGHLMSVGHALAKMRFRRDRDSTGLRAWRYYPTEELKSAPRHANGVAKRSLFALPPLHVAGGVK